MAFLLEIFFLFFFGYIFCAHLLKLFRKYFENTFCESAYLLKPPSLPVAPAAILEVLALLLVRTFI